MIRCTEEELVEEETIAKREKQKKRNQDNKSKENSLYQQKKEIWYKEGDIKWQKVFFLEYKYYGN